MSYHKEYRVIPLTRGFVAIISKEDYRKVNKYSWYVHQSAGKGRKFGQPYARTTINGRAVYLHRFIMGEPDGMHVDHLNHQTLDCRRENLEAVTPKVNNNRRRVCKKKDYKI